MKVSQVLPTLREMYDLRSELVPCLIGKPGIGKTQGIQDLARRLGVKVVTFILSNTVPSEVSGIRMPDRDTKKLEVFDDARMSSLEDGDILFFDEILEAQPALWSACLTLIQDRVMASGRKLPDVFIVAASNPVATPAMIPASTRDRFVFLNVEFDWDGWRRWMMDRFPRLADIDRLRPWLIGNYDENFGYNLISPRKMTKLVEWFDHGSSDVKRWVIEEVYDRRMLNDIEAQFKLSPRQTIVAEVCGIDAELAEEVASLSMAKMLERLQASEHWAEIAERLGGLEVEVK